VQTFRDSHNLIIAPNIKGQHNIKNLQEVVQGLKDIDAARGTREDIVDWLMDMGQKAAGRR
jgi:hypothetical protein